MITARPPVSTKIGSKYLNRLDVVTRALQILMFIHEENFGYPVDQLALGKALSEFGFNLSNKTFDKDYLLFPEDKILGSGINISVTENGEISITWEERSED